MDKKRLKKIAIKMIGERGLINLSRIDLCKRAKIPNGSFTYWAGCGFTEFLSELDDNLTDPREHIVRKSRIAPKIRKRQLMTYAVKLAESRGVENISSRDLANEAGVSVSLVTHYFGTVHTMRDKITNHMESVK